MHQISKHADAKSSWNISLRKQRQRWVGGGGGGGEGEAGRKWVRQGSNERETDRQTDRQTDRDRQTETDRDRDIQKDRQRDNQPDRQTKRQSSLSHIPGNSLGMPIKTNMQTNKCSFQYFVHFIWPSVWLPFVFLFDMFHVTEDDVSNTTNSSLRWWIALYSVCC